MSDNIMAERLRAIADRTTDEGDRTFLRPPCTVAQGAAYVADEFQRPLPCPFCGEQEGVYSEAGTEATGPHAAIVRCSGCNAVHCHNTEAEALAAWNRRASDAEIERLRADMAANSMDFQDAQNERLTAKLMKIAEQEDYK